MKTIFMFCIGLVCGVWLGEQMPWLAGGSSVASPVESAVEWRFYRTCDPPVERRVSLCVGDFGFSIAIADASGEPVESSAESGEVSP